MNKREIAKRINVSLATMYNWEKTKPELIKLIKLGLEREAGIPQNQTQEDKKEKGVDQLQKIIETFNETINAFGNIIESYQVIIKESTKQKNE